MTDEWSQAEHAEELSSRDRIVILYYADWCPYSRAFLPIFEAAEAEASVPMARANLRKPADARWDEDKVEVVPTVVYYEHAEELERVEAKRHKGLTGDDLERFLESVDGLQEEWRVIRGRLRPDRFG